MENENTTPKSSKENKLSLPIAIAFAGILIAGAIVYDKVEIRVDSNQNKPQVANGQGDTIDASLNNVRTVSKNRDHIRGNPNAEIFIIEYSDTECPFCKQFHSTLKKIIDEYGSSNRVAWVYRHFPLEQLHSKARSEANALECANELGGPEKFWQYTDRLYEVTPANNGLDLLELPKIAQYVGIDTDSFNACLTSGRHNSRIDEDLQNAIDTGGRGTPWSIIVTKKGDKYPISGAMSYESIKQIIDSTLKNI